MLYAFLASGAVALCSLVGILFFKDTGTMRGAHRFILPFAVGVFLSIIFLELVPETLAAAPSAGPLTIIAGFFLFYYLAHVLTTYHHHHNEGCEDCVDSTGRMVLIGDAIHNIADGVVIGSAFLLNPSLGIVTTIGIIMHELPQEIAEFGVLIGSGYSRSRALFLNFLSALSVILGTALVFLFAAHAAAYIWVLTGVAAGNLLYIATSDLIPELQRTHRHHFYQVFVAALAGVLLIFFSLSLAHTYTEEHGLEHTDGHEAAVL